MKRILLTLALLLLPSACWAQCNGVFPNNTACGNISGAGNLPRPVPLTSFPANAPGGATGNVQTNSGSGTFAGITNTQLTALINTFTSSLPGAVPASGGSSTNLFLNQAGAFSIPPSPMLTSSTLISGASTTYTASICGQLLVRTNSGAMMSDILPGTSPGGLPANCTITIENFDTGILSIKTGAGGTIETSTASTGYVYLCPGQTAQFFSNGNPNGAYWEITGPAQCKLQGSTSLFVATTGSNINDGLTVSTPLLDPTFAYNLVKNNFNLAGNNITFSIATGTYSPINLTGPLLGAISLRSVSNVLFVGNPTTPANVVIADTSASTPIIVGAILESAGAVADFNGFQLTSTNNNIIILNNGSVLHAQNLDFHHAGSGGNHVVSINGSNFVAVGNYTISGGGGCHWIAGQGGAVESFIPNGSSTITVTVTGTPAFSSGFACAQYPSLITTTTPMAFSGSATGLKCNADFNGVVTGSSVFPGTGTTTSTGGICN